MSHFTAHQLLASSADRFNYTIITPQYSPDTTIAISLRHFEKESKAQAEREYDAEHGPMPDPPADDDDSIDIKERTIMKKKRKVRSAIVSRRKTAIYEKKLEDELQLRDNVNADLKARLNLYNDVLRDIQAKVHTMQRSLDARKEVPKRMRTNALPPHSLSRLPQQSANLFHPQDTIDEMLFSAEEPTTVASMSNKQMPNINDFTSECSDRQISPMLQPQHPEQVSREMPCGFPAEDNTWNQNYLPQTSQRVVVQMLGGSFA